MGQDPNILSVREYESFTIGSRWDVAKKTISKEEASAIEHYQSKIGIELFEISYRDVKATNWVGTFGVGGKSIEVVPKIDSSEDTLSKIGAKENLLFMVSQAGYVSLTATDIARLANEGKPLLIAFLDLYVDNLGREWRRGTIKKYVPQAENRTFLRGKLLFQDQLRENLIQKQRFYTLCDEFIEDNQISQLLKSALFSCLKQKMCEGVARKAKCLLPDFETVSEANFSLEELQKLCVDRQIKRFEPLVNLAKMIVRDCSPSSAPSGANVYSLMFDMNEVFERFIAAELRIALMGRNVAVKTQVEGKSLLHQKGNKRFHLRPDLGVFRGEKSLCILDTKWKKLDIDKPYANVSQSDIYQIYAYGKEFDAPLTILLYPRFGNIPEIVAEYEHNVSSNPIEQCKKVIIGSVDVSAPLNLFGNQQHLRTSLSSMVFR